MQTIKVAGVDNVTAELWTAAPGKETQYATTFIRPGDKKFTMNLFNIYKMNDPIVKEEYEKYLVFPDGNRIFIDRDMAAAVDTYVTSARDAEAREGKLHTALVPLKTLYELRVKIKGRLLKRYPIVLDKGQKKQRKITGQLSSTRWGAIQLDFEPEIDIPTVEVTKDKGTFAPGKVQVSRPRE